MAIGAKDYIDQLLVKKYAKEQVDNHENTKSLINPEKMMSAMNDYASMSRNMFVLNQRLNNACSRLNARSARYTRPIQLQQAA
jgi:3-methyladenine DNA glycosylase AlkC